MTERHFKCVRYFYFHFLTLNEYQRDSHQVLLSFWNLPARFPRYNYIIVEINLSSNLTLNEIEANISTFHCR